MLMLLFPGKVVLFKLVFSAINGAQLHLLYGCKLWVWFLLCFSLNVLIWNAIGNIRIPSPNGYFDFLFPVCEL